MAKTIKNQDRKFRENEIYVPLKVRGIWILFTENQIKVAAARAKKNPEDLEKLIKKEYKKKLDSYE